MSQITVILHTAPPPGMRPDDAALTKIDGRESVMRAMELFANRAAVARTIVTIDQAQAEVYKQKIGSHLMFMGIKLVQAGPTWIEQIRAAKEKLDDAENVLIHDAARPAVPFTDLDALTALIGRYPVLGLAARVTGDIVRAKIIPGIGALEPVADLATLLSPVLYQRAAFDALCESGARPHGLQLLEGSSLNVRVGAVSPAFLKAMLGLLPKPKVQGPSSPFEEAQW